MKVERASYVTPEQYERLPKFARDYVNQLEMRNDEQDKLIRELRNVVTDDCEEGIIISPYSSYPIHFDPRNTVRFWVEPGRLAIDIDVRKHMNSPKKDGLHVCGYGSAASSSLHIQPCSSNVIHISGSGW